MLALDLLLVAHSGLGVVLSWDAIDVEEVVYHAISEICSIRPLVNPVSSCLYFVLLLSVHWDLPPKQD